MVGLAIYLDFDQISYAFHLMVEYSKEHPGQAVSIILVTYVVCNVLLIPTLWIHYLTAYIYARKMESFQRGMIVALAITFVGMQLGAYSSFFISRHCL